ncbi:MAG TPA: class I SAM-dependent methyltransferase [Thermoleophilaceae bacterium]|nr:class I SAM-dependent methyltransferase [Thermoleophilaceae bacterium]
MEPAVGPCVEPPQLVAISRDVRARKIDTGWLVHFRADAPANVGFRLSNQAFSWLARFGDGEIFRDRTPARRAAVEQFIQAGVLIGARYALLEREVELTRHELIRLRTSIEIQHLGVLELEAVLLYLLARENRQRGRICELGSMFGGSTIALALGAAASRHRNTVLAVDDHEWHRHLARPPDASMVRSLPTTLTIFRRNLRRARVADRVKLVVADTAEFGSGFGGHISLLFVDADHSLPGVRRDLDAWLPRVPPAGLAAFHDYANAMWPDVKHAVDRHAAKFSRFSVWQTMAVAQIGS